MVHSDFHFPLHFSSLPKKKPLSPPPLLFPLPLQQPIFFYGPSRRGGGRERKARRLLFSFPLFPRKSDAYFPVSLIAAVGGGPPRPGGPARRGPSCVWGRPRWAGRLWMRILTTTRRRRRMSRRKRRRRGRRGSPDSHLDKQENVVK